MHHHRLGRSGLHVSPLCLGTMNFGGPTDAATATGIVDRAREQGVNMIDTADAYTGGRSEEITGAAIRAHRHHWVLATKVANPLGPGPNSGGVSRRWVHEAIDGSLRRLGVEHVDVYYLHKEDHGTPLGETVRALADLVRSGKIRYFGVSNYRSWRVAEICTLCDREGIDRPVVSQPYYHALNRTAEAEHLPACAYYGLGVVSYSPLARGILTAKYDPDVPPPPETRAGRADKRMMQTEWRPESLRMAREIAVHAEARGTTAARFAISWVLHNRIVTGVIGGPRTEAQWDDYVAALDYRFTAEDEALIARLVSPGHNASPGYNDPAYPIEGRPIHTEHSA